MPCNLIRHAHHLKPKRRMKITTGRVFRPYRIVVRRYRLNFSAIPMIMLNLFIYLFIFLLYTSSLNRFSGRITSGKSISMTWQICTQTQHTRTYEKPNCTFRYDYHVKDAKIIFFNYWMEKKYTYLFILARRFVFNLITPISRYMFV